VTLLGREGALTDLAARVARAGESVGSLVLVSGAAGIGKTALCERVVADGIAAGHRAAWAACWQSAAVPALWPWAQLLARLAPDGEQVLQRASGSADPVAARFAQFDAVTRALTDAAAGAVLILVIDDLHWADPATLELLGDVAGVIRTVPVVLLATYRPEDTGPQTALGERLPRLRRNAHELSLPPLDDDAVSALLADRIGGAAVPPETEAELRHLAGGNPLFVTELARLVAERGAELGGGTFEVPPSVRDVVAARLDGVDADCRELLDWAAVVGDVVPLTVLTEVAGRPPERTIALLDDAIAASIVRARADGRFDFAHPLYRAVVYGGLSTAARVALHAGVGAALERMSERGYPVDSAALAHHFGRSAPAGTAAKAARYAVEAGDEASRMAAYASAASRYRQALAALELDPSAGDRIAVLLALAAAEAATGAGDAATGTFRTAADLARAAGRPRELGQAALGLTGGPGIEVPISDPARSEVLTEALAALGDDAPGLRAWLSARLSVALTMSAPLERRVALADDAIVLAERAGDDGALAHALAARCDVIAGPAHIAERERAARRIVELARSTGSAGIELLGQRLLVEALFERGAVDEAESVVTGYARTAGRLRDPRYTFYVPLWRGAVSLARGDRDGYVRHRADLTSAVQAAGTENATTLALVQDLIAAVDFEPDRAPGVHAMTGEITMPEGGVAVTTALVRHREGRTPEALRLLASEGGRIMALPRDSEWLPAIVQIADMARELPAEPLVAWAYRELAPYPDAWSVEGIGAAVRGPAERALGLLAARLGDRDAARAHFDRALAACGRSGVVAWADRTERDAEAALGTTRPAAIRSGESGVLRCEGDVWLIDYAGRSARVRDSKGVRDLARLLAGPGRSVAALDLIADGRPTVVAESPGPAIDAHARSAYRRRLQEIEEELDAADAGGDPARSAGLSAERDAIAAELSGAYGLGGRTRRTGSSAERARTAVTTRIRDTIRRMAGVHPELAKHLDRSVHTGTFCEYTPDPMVRWQVSSPRI
jgi:tetratricopeptide (TPR) repeat protein